MTRHLAVKNTKKPLFLVDLITGCHSNVLAIADRICSGKHDCEIRVPDADMEKTRPCLQELKTFLEVGYTCVPGLSHYKIFRTVE